jgi:hypothetical protein
MNIGALAAPVIAVVALLIGQWSSAPVVTPAASVLLGYFAGLLASRYDIGVIKEKKE